ncbi:outer membrane protein assembly factor BamB family protein [Streptomyces sp. SP17KL33]|uniref:outer membrane protein assembly factor BamB family protein n=1 Tax=Streptomyces sp. SP17KL33 TaxID=3002534 RepID=UPI002E798609|nr:PQQ-binding-like beta-propeller repeat protein [Streptomyces sp. SP17KL33]MEE1836514.1 PQQ-binding-like beta-propeller repeat protein [Streptomyces sp. SP17KL33]
MTTERVEEKVRETLHAVALDRVRAPGDLAEQVVRRRARRRLAQATGAAVAVAAITVGAVFGLGGGSAVDPDRPVRPAVAPQGWKPWQSDDQDATDRGCLVDGAALYCAGSEYDVAKFDARTGERLWTVEVNREGDGPDHPFAVRDGVVYAFRNHTAQKQPNGDYVGGTDLMAVGADTGELLWKVEMPQDDRSDQAAMLIDGAVLANTPTLRTMSALDPLTGEEKWRHTWDKGIACQRTVLGGVPYLLCMEDADEPGATEVFRLDPATGQARKVATVPGAQLLAGISGDRMVLFAPKDRAGGKMPVTLLSGSGERTSLSYPIEGELAELDVAGDRLISVSWKGEASAYSLTTGDVLWTAPVGVEMPGRNTMPGLAPPLVSERQQVVYFLSPTGDLSGLDLRTGEQIWRDHVDTRTGPGPDYNSSPRLLAYEDVLVAQRGSKLVSLLPRLGD